MKTGTIFIVVWMCIGTIQAQEKTEKHIDFSGKKFIELNIQIADSIILHTWNRNEVFILSSVNINENRDNDAYLTTYNETSGSVAVNARFRDDYFKGRNNCCNEADIFWDIYIPDNTEFRIETINGNITIDGETDKMKVKTISGYIDLTEPVGKPADIDFSTISGTIYSNHVLALTKMHGGVPTKITERLNNGGSLIRLETISGDIFFRKSK